MLPDRVSNPGPLTYESGALPIALRGPAYMIKGEGQEFPKPRSHMGSGSRGPFVSLAQYMNGGAHPSSFTALLFLLFRSNLILVLYFSQARQSQDRNFLYREKQV